MSTRVESTNFYDYTYPNLGNKLYDLLKNNNILVLLNRINLLYLESNENSTLLSKFAINDALFIERLDYNNFILNIITYDDNFRRHSQKYSILINSILKQVKISEYQDEDNSIITNNYKSDLKEEVNKIFIYYLFAEISKYNQDNLKNNIENSLNILRIFFNYN